MMKIKCRNCRLVYNIDERIISYVRCMNCGEIVTKIDGKGVDYKEVANNMNARILSVGFSKDNRFIEIIGTQMKP